jgi:hypothetical protein
MNPIIPFIIAGVVFGFLVLIVFMVLILRGWTIPVVVFRIVGDKRRPVLDLTKRAKIINQHGVKKLKIRGTPHLWELKNFQAENYYMSVNGKQALVLLEFAKDCYTPIRPTLIKRIFGGEELKELRKLPVLVPVEMELGEGVMNDLLLKAVDDFDPDFIVRNFARIESQYSGGWRQFLKEFGWIIGWILLFTLALVGMVLFFQKAPELAAACAQAGVATTKSVLAKAAGTIPTG